MREKTVWASAIKLKKVHLTVKIISQIASFFFQVLPPLNHGYKQWCHLKFRNGIISHVTRGLKISYV